jgi:valyl-tRNA synthetase
VYEKVLRLLHPFAPYVTEELWQRLTDGARGRPIALAVAEWPTAAAAHEAVAEEQFADVMALTRAARTLRAEYRVEASRTIPATIATNDAERASFWRSNAALVGALPGTRLRPVEVVQANDGTLSELATRSIAAVAGGVELLVPAEGLFDVAAELTRVERELAEAHKQVQRLESLLASDFSAKAAADTVERERERLAAQRERLSALERRRETLTRLRS